MSEVALQIGGRTYRVACAPGEEERVTRLGATIANKLASIGNPSGPDAQNLLFAALLLADEVHEAREKGGGPADAAGDREQSDAQIVAMESELARLRNAQRAAADEITEREAEASRLQAEIAELHAALPAASGIDAMAELAPALEKFAEMLEECADKLERRPQAS